MLSAETFVYLGLSFMALIVSCGVWAAMEVRRERRRIGKKLLVDMRLTAADRAKLAAIDADHERRFRSDNLRAPRFVRHDPLWVPPAPIRRPAVQTGPIGATPAQQPSSAHAGGFDPVVGFGLGFVTGHLLHGTPEPAAPPPVDTGASCPDTGFASSYDSGGGFDGGSSGGGE